MHANAIEPIKLTVTHVNGIRKAMTEMIYIYIAFKYPGIIHNLMCNNNNIIMECALAPVPRWHTRGH